MGDNFEKQNTVLYARNVCFDFAKEKNIKYFMQLDDDYMNFNYRFDNNLKYTFKKMRLLEKNIFSMIKFLEKTN
ncbi:MAG: hypothetical protein QXX91_01925, partial [Thermoplasmata archaeon]